MKELKEFTVERLEQIAKTQEKYDHRYLDNQLTASEARSLAKIALAAKQAQPVCFIGKQMLIDLNEENRTCGRVWLAMVDEVDGNDRIPLYTAPPLNHTEQDGWIKCSERLPDVGMQVLATNSTIKTFEVAIFDIGNVSKRHFFGASNGKYIATHWMPLPAAPKPDM